MNTELAKLNVDTCSPSVEKTHYLVFTGRKKVNHNADVLIDGKPIEKVHITNFFVLEWSYTSY